MRSVRSRVTLAVFGAMCVAQSVHDSLAIVTRFVHSAQHHPAILQHRSFHACRVLQREYREGKPVTTAPRFLAAVIKREQHREPFVAGAVR